MTTLMSIQEYAHSIGVGPNKLFKWLRNKDIFYYRDGYNIPQDAYIRKGYFKVITSEFIKKSNKTENEIKCYGYRTYITTLGSERLTAYLKEKGVI